MGNGSRPDGERRSDRLCIPNCLPASSRGQAIRVQARRTADTSSRRRLPPTLRFSFDVWTRVPIDGNQFLICATISPSKGLQCHTDQDSHRRIKCNQPCLWLSCPRAHPCPLLCSDDCGDCKFPMYDIRLPCGHVAASIPWQVLCTLVTQFSLMLALVICSKI